MMMSLLLVILSLSQGLVPSSPCLKSSFAMMRERSARMSTLKDKTEEKLKDKTPIEPTLPSTPPDEPEVEVSKLDAFFIDWGLKEDPRIPEDCRVTPMERIKSSGRAGVAAYALTEGAFWLSSLPLSIALVVYTTGDLPDVSTLEGKEQIAGYVFALTTFARGLVPVRIALALALAPWCDKNVIQRFFPPESLNQEDCDLEDHNNNKE